MSFPSEINNLNVEILLLEIEDLFQRFRSVPLTSRALIWEKIRIKIIEEFKDFLIQENDGIQDIAFEIPYSTAVQVNLKSGAFTDLSTSFEEYSTLPIVSTKGNDDDFLSFLQPPIFKQDVKEDLSKNEINCTESKNPAKERSVLLFLCDFCGQKFRGKNKFQSHLEFHKAKNGFECTSCSLSFDLKEDLAKHSKIHDKKQEFCCQICQKKLSNKRVLENHFRVIHSKEQKFSCEKCNYFAYSNHTLKEHNRVKHDKCFKKYACVLCKNIYNSAALLKVHLRSHAGERPYKCQKCNAAFISAGGLYNHDNNIHSDKKFTCEVCSKHFKTVHHLRRHSFIHTRIKPFTCPFCTNYASNTQGNLTKHVKIVHQINDFSYYRYKKMTLGELEEVKDEWLLNGEDFMKDYLKKLTDKAVTTDRMK